VRVGVFDHIEKDEAVIEDEKASKDHSNTNYAIKYKLLFLLLFKLLQLARQKLSLSKPYFK
jgi:hypothetical protein